MPSLKIGPGNSARSHTANEYIRLEEIREGLNGLNLLFNMLNYSLKQAKR